jgi:DNA-binding SARP family transcriptional activator
MIYVRTLGRASIAVGDQRITPDTDRRFALLLYLAAEQGRPVPKAALRELIYPDRTEENAAHSLRQVVYKLRCAGVDLRSTATALELPLEEVQLDVDAFVAAARLDPACVDMAALGFLPGYAPEHSDAFAEWLDAYRARSVREVCATLTREAKRAKRAGDWVQAERAMHACLTLDPSNDEATLLSAEMAAMNGARTRALGLIDEYMAGDPRRSAELRLPAVALRRRIAETTFDSYPGDGEYPFVGREREMEVLHEAFVEAKRGRSHCVVLSGDPGMGKSRVASEFCRLAGLEGGYVEAAIAQPNDEMRPLGVFVQLVSRLRQAPGSLGCAPESLEALRYLTSHAGAVLHVEGAEQSESRFSAVTRAIDDLVDAICVEKTLVLKIEDAHWIDPMSMRLLYELASPAGPRRLLVIVTTRDKPALPNVFRHADCIRCVELDPLGSSPASHLVTSALRGLAAEDDAMLHQWITDSALGNPLFIVSLVAYYKATGTRFAIPATLTELLNGRLQRTSAIAATVLRTCALLGRHCTLKSLIDCLDLTQVDLLMALEELESARLIHATGAAIVSAHSLLMDAVVAATPEITLRAIHRRIAEILGQEVNRSAESLSVLWDSAEHWVAAGDAASAVAGFRDCAGHALAVGRPREAAESLLRACRLVGAPAHRQMAADAFRIADAIADFGLVVQAGELIDGDASLSRDDIELATLVARLTDQYNCQSAAAQLKEYFQSSSITHHQRLRAGLALLMYADEQVDSALAAELFDVLRTSLERDDAMSEAVSLRFLLVYHSSLGDIDRSVDIADRLIELSESSTPHVAIECQQKAGVAYWRAGICTKALSAWHMVYDRAIAIGSTHTCFLTALLLANAYRHLRDESNMTMWMQRAEDTRALVSGSNTRSWQWASYVDNAVATNDLERLQDLWTDVSQVIPKEPSRFVTRFLKATRIHLDLMQGKSCDPPTAARELTSEHQIGLENGNVGDFELAAILHASAKSKWAVNARTVLAQYLRSYRRSRGPLSRTLQVAIEHLCGDAGISSPLDLTHLHATRLRPVQDAGSPS